MNSQTLSSAVIKLHITPLSPGCGFCLPHFPKTILQWLKHGDQYAHTHTQQAYCISVSPSVIGWVAAELSPHAIWNADGVNWSWMCESVYFMTVYECALPLTFLCLLSAAANCPIILSCILLQWAMTSLSTARGFGPTARPCRCVWGWVSVLWRSSGSLSRCRARNGSLRSYWP